MRPADTENIINNRQQIRLFTGLSFFLCSVYFAIEPLFTQVQASWVHLFHLILSPISFLVTITENEYMMYVFMYIYAFALFADVSIAALNFIAVSRCFGDPTASCFDRLYENSVWFLLALSFSALSMLTALQFRNLRAQMLEKDTYRPTYDNLKIIGKKLETLHLFLIPSDIVYTVIVLSETTSTPIYWLGITHVFLDPYVFLTGKSWSRQFYDFIRIVYIAVFFCDVIIFVLNSEIHQYNLAQSLAFIMLIVYICMDAIMLVLVTEVINVFNSMRQAKKVL